MKKEVQNAKVVSKPGWRNWYTQWIQNPPPHGLRVRVSLPAQNKRARRESVSRLLFCVRERDSKARGGEAGESASRRRGGVAKMRRRACALFVTEPLPAPIQIFHYNLIVPRVVTLYHKHIWVQTVRPTKASSKVAMLRLEKPRARKKSDLKPDARRGKPRTKSGAYGGRNLQNRFRKWERI